MGANGVRLVNRRLSLVFLLFAPLAVAAPRPTVIFRDDFERDNPWTFLCRGVGEQKLDNAQFHGGKRALLGISDRFELLHVRKNFKLKEQHARLSFWCYADYEPGDEFWTRLVVGMAPTGSDRLAWVSLTPPSPRQWVRRELLVEEISPALSGANLNRLDIGLRGRGAELKLSLDEVVLENDLPESVWKPAGQPIAPPTFAPGPLTWAVKEKVRAIYATPGRGEGARYRDLFQAPINTVLLGSADPDTVVEWAARCTAYNRHLFLVLPAFRPLTELPDGKTLRRAQFADAIDEAAVCPREVRFWEGAFAETMKSVAELAALVKIEGVVLDLRLPAGSKHPSYSQLESCLCDDCFDAFLKEQKSLERAQYIHLFERRLFLVRRGWLRRYAIWMESMMIDLARNAATSVRAQHKNFVLGIFGFDNSWLARGLAQGFASTGVPVLLLSSEPARTEGYNVRVRESTAAARQLGFPVLFVPGLTTESAQPSLAEHLARAGLGSDGFWVTPPAVNQSGAITKLGNEIRDGYTRLRDRLEAAPAPRKSTKK